MAGIEYSQMSGRMRMKAREAGRRGRTGIAGYEGFDGVIDDARDRIVDVAKTAAGIITDKGKVKADVLTKSLLETVNVIAALRDPINKAMAEGQDVEDIATEYNVRTNSANVLMRTLQSAIKTHTGKVVKMPYLQPVGVGGEAVQFGFLPLVIAAIGPIVLVASAIAVGKLGVEFGKRVMAEVEKAKYFADLAAKKLIARAAGGVAKSLFTPANVAMLGIGGYAVYTVLRKGN